MKQVVQVRLDTTREQFRTLSSTLAACNDTANIVSAVAYAAGASHHRLHPRDLQAKTYAQARQAGLGSQGAVRCIKKVADAYTALRANLKGGNYGDKGSRRRAKAESRPVTFRPGAALPFDDRNLSWDWAGTDPRRGAVSSWTLEGRLKGVSFVGHPDQVALLRQYRKGETDLLIRGGVAYLIATLEAPEKPLNLSPHLGDPGGWPGTDLGIANIATTSDGRKIAGKTVNRYRQRQVRLRARLQGKGTKSARRLPVQASGAQPAAPSTGNLAEIRQSTSARRATSLSTPTSTQPSTSPRALLVTGLLSTSHTRHDVGIQPAA